jgi:hypothetical protein
MNTNGNSVHEHDTQLRYCTSCGEALPISAAFCPVCGHKAAEDSPQHVFITAAGQAPKTKQNLTLIIIASVVVIAAIIGCAWWYNRSHSERVTAKAEYDNLSARLAALTTANASVSTLTGSIGQGNNQLATDENRASTAGNKRHEEGLGDRNVFVMSDLAKQEQDAITDAQSVQSSVESNDSGLLSAYESAYGSAGVRQFRSDLTARNQARDNELTEWSRAISEINDSLTGDISGRSGEYSDTEEADHYTASDEAGNEASRYQIMSNDDSAALYQHLKSDIASIKTRIDQLRTSFPDIGK